MPRTLAFVSTLLLAAFCALPAQADSFIMRLLNKPVPGGVAVVDLGEEGPPPRAFYQGKPVLVVREEGRRWIAVVGIPLSTKPGPQKLEVRAATGNHEERFSVGSKHYREQRITLKNKRQVNPLPEDLKRIERELAEQTAAYRRFSPGLPSNLMLERIGPRRWIACLMLVWGCLSTAMLLVETARGFYLLRFLLGVAEAGFFPGILVYLNRWFPARRRGQITALFAIAVPMAGVIGGPLSGWILEGFHDALGLRGWQWMFLIEGLPVVLLGVVVWCSLPESFERVTWLSDEQKHLLREELAGEEQRKTITSFSGIFSNPQVWLLVAIYFAVMLAVNTIAFWMPSLIHGAGIAQDSRIGMLSAVPYLAGCAFMIFIGRSSDRLRERRWHLGIPLLMAAAGLSLAALAPTSAWLVMGGLVIAGMGASAALPMFWQLPPAFLSSATLAAGIALISSFGSIAAFLAPYLIGWMRDTTQSASLALYLLAILIALGAGLVLRTPAAVVNPR